MDEFRKSNCDYVFSHFYEIYNKFGLFHLLYVQVARTFSYSTWKRITSEATPIGAG